MSELEAPNLQGSTKRCSRGFGRRGQWSIGAPGGAGTDDGCRFGVVSEFGRRTVLAFLFHCVPSLVEDDSSAPFDG